MSLYLLWNAAEVQEQALVQQPHLGADLVAVDLLVVERLGRARYRHRLACADVVAPPDLKPRLATPYSSTSGGELVVHRDLRRFLKVMVLSKFAATEIGLVKLPSVPPVGLTIALVLVG